jgi:hypothetical protein
MGVAQRGHVADRAQDDDDATRFGRKRCFVATLL